MLRNKHVSNHLKGVVYKAHVLSTLLYGCEVCVEGVEVLGNSLTEEVIKGKGSPQQL